MRFAAPIGLCLLCLLCACSESFLPPSVVELLRVVGARVELQGDSDRPRPDPGDDIEVSLLVIDQGAPPSDFPEVPALTPELLQWDFISCIPLPTLIGPPICGPRIQPCEGCTATPPADPFAYPVMRFQVPSEAELSAAGASSVFLQGAICADGAPADEDVLLRYILGETDDLNPCKDPNDEGRFVSVSIQIEPTPEDPNLSPDIMDVFYKGRPWPPPYDQGVPRTAPRTGCVADLAGLSDEQRAAHPSAGDPPASIRLDVTQESLQSYTIDEKTLTEEIQVSWLADGGGFDLSFSFIVDPERMVSIQWQPFTEVPDDGLLVRFNFVIRDGRGGTDWLERGLCIVPPPPPESPP